MARVYGFRTHKPPDEYSGIKLSTLIQYYNRLACVATLVEQDIY